MKSRYSDKAEFFERTKQKFGPMMEEYAREKHKNSENTDFEELEKIRNKSRAENFRYNMAFRLLTGLGVLVFLYFFLALAGQDILAFFYN